MALYLSDVAISLVRPLAKTAYCNFMIVIYFLLVSWFNLYFLFFWFNLYFLFADLETDKNEARQQQHGDHG